MGYYVNSVGMVSGEQDKNQKTRPVSSDTVQKPNEEKTAKEGKFFKHRCFTKIHNDRSF